MRLEKLLCKITKRRFYFSAQIRYIPDTKNANTYVSREILFGLDSRDASSLLRTVRKAYGPKLIAGVPKYLLKNGKVEIKNLNYIGWFK